MSREIEQYYKQIEHSLFTCPKRKRTSFLREFRGSVSAYVEEHPQATMQELQNIFGTPESIAEAFLQSDEFSTTKKVISSKRRIARIVLIAISVLVAAAVILGAIYVIGKYSYWEKKLAQEEAGEFSKENYEIVVSDISWEDALADAKAKGGKLACFESMEEYRFVLGLIAEADRVENMYYSLGGRRDSYDDTYYWVDADNKPYGKPLNGKGGWTEECWGPGEPNLIYKDRLETVVVLYYNNAEARWAWYDGSATYRNPQKTYGYIIEYRK